MSNNTEKNIFRLSAVLYADNNYEVSSQTTIRKVVEAALLEVGSPKTTVHDLINFIETSYHLILDETEILKIIRAHDENFITHEKHGETFVTLSEKRKISLSGKLKDKTIDFFIEQFVESLGSGLEKSKTKEVIYNFLYELLMSNVEGIKKLVDDKGKIKSLEEFDHYNFSSSEKELINEFLRWENDDKNIAIFNIASYAVEYCMLCNNGTGVNLQLSNLRNKTFYLDTNVIFRALGLNGARRKERSRQFLNKFRELNTELKISKFSEIEFKNTVKFYVDKLRKVPLYGSLNPRIFDEKYFNRKDDFNTVYYNWRAGKVNDSLELFEAYLLGLYELFKTEYKIDADYSIPFDENDEAVESKINYYTSEIGSHKQKESVNHGAVSDMNDALNVLLIEFRRDGKYHNIFDTKVFFLSTDQSLRRWDYHRNITTPIVILPSQWMSILLRYVNRTADDYKSFVSFLNLPLQESSFSNERLHVVLSGISEMTSNFEQQYNLVQLLVQNKFEGILEDSYTDEQVLQNVKDFAEQELSKRIENLERQHEETKNEHLVKISESQSTIEALKGTIESKVNNLEGANTRNKTLLNNHVSFKLRIWKQWAYFLFLPLFLLSIIFVILAIVAQESDWNIVANIMEEINKDANEARKQIYSTLFYGVPIGIIPTCGIASYKRIFSEEAIEEKREKIIKRYDT